MNRQIASVIAAAFFAALAAPGMYAQAITPPFSMRVQIQGRVEIPSDGGTLTMAADGIGLPVPANLTLLYTGTATNTTVTLNGATFSGSTDFSISGTGGWPITLTTISNTAAVGLQYAPTTSKAQQAKIVFAFTQTVTQNGIAVMTNGTFSLVLSGTASEFVYTYIPQPNGNSTLLNAGDTIQFPLTDVLATSSTLIVLTNRGSGQGVVNGITYTGSKDFALAGLPFPPTTVDAGKDLRFMVQFTPSDLPTVKGAVRVDFVAGRNLMFQVMGTGQGAFYEYEILSKNTAIPLDPDGLIPLPDANVNEKSQVMVRVRNVGNADGTIRTFMATGAAFSISEVPFIPAVLFAGGGTATLTVNFLPTQPGKALGKLRIGLDSFDLAGTGLGATLTYAYISGGSTFPLQTGNSVVFPPVAVGQTSTVRITVSNTGSAPAAVNSISTGGPTATTFVLGGVPTVPANVAPDGNIGFNVTFAPTTMGTLTGTLRIDNQTYTLTGIGNAPNPLPTYAFQGNSGPIDPLQQPGVGLALNADYPLDINGTLTMVFSSDVFANDPAVQFAVGGRTVSFTIPANTRQAVFSNRATQIRLQSGTVAGSIVLTPSFVTTGGIDVTPVNPTPVTLTIPSQSPVLSSVVLAAKTTNSLTLLITGYSTGRSITQMDFQFTANPTETVGASKVTVNVEPSFNAWYQSTASQAFGSNFTVSVPFTLAGDLHKVGTLIETVQSVAVTLTNRQGVSASKSVDIK